MKVVILAGGLGTRLAEETEVKPKPMVEIGGRPILWHIMKYYSFFGFNEFIVALGHKGEIIKRFFLDYYSLSSGALTVNLSNGDIKAHQVDRDNWIVHLVDTGLNSMTGGRLKRVASWIGNEPFMLTYGDGVANINLNSLIDFHKKNNRLVTVSAVRPPARFGGLRLNGGSVAHFTEKHQTGEGWINGGFMVVEPEVIQRIEGDNTSFENDVLEKLADEGQLAAFPHPDFWQCMDTLREKRILEEYWEEKNAPWKIWT